MFLASGCRDIAAPHELPDGQGDVELVDAREISDPATLAEIEWHYRDVSECLGVPFDERKFRLTNFHTAESIIWNGDPAVGVTGGKYIYVLRPINWLTMRHEIVHRIDGRGHPEVDPLMDRCVPLDWREAAT